MASNDPDHPDLSDDPQPGDLIEIFRPAYQHWALYLGDGYIINLTPVGQWEPPLALKHLHLDEDTFNMPERDYIIHICWWNVRLK